MKGFSKRIDSHCAALAVYFFWYNWVRIHKTLRVSPAMAAGLTDKLMEMSDLVAMIDAANPPKKRGHIRKLRWRETREQSLRACGLHIAILCGSHLPVLRYATRFAHGQTAAQMGVYR